jgi:hypothetical protein
MRSELSKVDDEPRVGESEASPEMGGDNGCVSDFSNSLTLIYYTA